MPAPVLCRAPLTCPSCGLKFTGQWPADLDDWHGDPAGAHTCPACSHAFEATWPGFTFEPEVVVLPPARPGQADTPASVVRPPEGGEGNASARRGGGVTSEDYRP